MTGKDVDVKVLGFYKEFPKQLICLFAETVQGLEESGLQMNTQRKVKVGKDKR